MWGTASFCPAIRPFNHIYNYCGVVIITIVFFLYTYLKILGMLFKLIEVCEKRGAGTGATCLTMLNNPTWPCGHIFCCMG